MSRFKDDWLKSAQSYPVLRTYVTFKQIFAIEPYIHCIKNCHLRKAFSTLRLSSHHLRIKTGRYVVQKVKEEERLCVLCEGNHVENEIHFY